MVEATESLSCMHGSDVMRTILRKWYRQSLFYGFMVCCWAYESQPITHPSHPPSPTATKIARVAASTSPLLDKIQYQPAALEDK